MGFKIIDAIGIGLIAVGLAMTVLLFQAVHGPAAEVTGMTIQELGPAPPPKPAI